MAAGADAGGIVAETRLAARVAGRSIGGEPSPAPVGTKTSFAAATKLAPERPGERVTSSVSVTAFARPSGSPSRRKTSVVRKRSCGVAAVELFVIVSAVAWENVPLGTVTVSPPPLTVPPAGPIVPLPAVTQAVATRCAGTKIGSPVRWLSMTVANAKKRPPGVDVLTTAYPSSSEDANGPKTALTWAKPHRGRRVAGSFTVPRKAPSAL